MAARSDSAFGSATGLEMSDYFIMAETHDHAEVGITMHCPDSLSSACTGGLGARSDLICLPQMPVPKEAAIGPGRREYARLLGRRLTMRCVSLASGSAVLPGVLSRAGRWWLVLSGRPTLTTWTVRSPAARSTWPAGADSASRRVRRDRRCGRSRAGQRRFGVPPGSVREQRRWRR